MASLPFLRRRRLLLLLFLAVEVGCSGGGAASGYNRPKARESLFVFAADDADADTPQQARLHLFLYLLRSIF
ncbi:hypothetical protein IEQ34_017968 [Dendrobium chrysotoxum]|uniref:Uncharacterized protein n=1 Tax=Dendrobium chrysotoxum TaxID=161865 RepID=A0AAV7FVI5_DENCH|nr:hypothetical protein IEQ34_017968 [Dendrobium chrysotoxum]